MKLKRFKNNMTRCSMKTGDEVNMARRPEWGAGKIVRFYANQSTVLVDFANKDNLTYCNYSSLVKIKIDK